MEDEEPLEEEEDNPDATRAGPPISIHVLEGPDAGKKKRFKSVRMVVGRGKDVDLRLTDHAVSRRHLELIHGDTGTLLRDLGGASGTKINDERVEEKVLKHGDEIAIGRTLLRFVDELEQVKQMRAEQETARPRRRRRKRRRRRRRRRRPRPRRQEAANATAANKAEVDPNDPRFQQGTQIRSVDSAAARAHPARQGGARRQQGPRPGRRGRWRGGAAGGDDHHPGQEGSARAASARSQGDAGHRRRCRRRAPRSATATSRWPSSSSRTRRSSSRASTRRGWPRRPRPRPTSPRPSSKCAR